MRDDDMTFDQFRVWSQVRLVIWGPKTKIDYLVLDVKLVRLVIWGPKTKTDYLVLDVKLLLININYVEFFFF